MIYKIILNNKSMIFPGDIQTKGWNRVRMCDRRIENCNFYCVSHHGSLNGHIRGTFQNKRSLRTVAECLPKDTLCILMGRDHAYSGIYDQSVLCDFCKHHILHMTERVPCCIHPNITTAYIRIEWETGRVNYFTDNGRI